VSRASRPPRRSRRVAALLATTLSAAVAVGGCSLGGDEPATVTLPEMDTTTTTVPGPPDELAPQGQAEPLPVAWILQTGGPGDDSLAALSGAGATVVAVGSTTGLTDSPSAGGIDVMVATVETSGELRSLTAAGSAGDDRATGVTSDEATLACGSTTGDLGAPSGGGLDAWCAVVGDDGALTTPSQLGASDDEAPTGVGTSPGIGHAYVSGSLGGLLPGAQDPTGRGLGGGDALMMQVDTAGRPVWARQFGTGLADSALAATGNPDGDGVVGGWTDGDLEGASKGGRDSWMSRFDPSGNQRWITQLGSSGTDSIVAVTATGEARQGTELFLGAGVTDADIDAEGPAINAGLNDGFVAAVGTDGSLEWISQFGSTFEETVGGIAADGATIYVTGSTGDELGDLLDGGGPGGARDGYLAALDAATGSVLWVSRFGSAGDETMTGLAVTEDGLLVASGTTTGQMGEQAPLGGSDGFVIAFPLSALGGGAASSV
jgi:hypothetical protein